MQQFHLYGVLYCSYTDVSTLHPSLLDGLTQTDAVLGTQVKWSEMY